MMESPSPPSPERRKMMDYLTVRVGPLTAAELLARMRAAVAEFEGVIRGVGPDGARTPMPGGEWNIAQVVDHVAQTQIRAAEELRHLLDGRRPPGPPVYDALVSGAAHWAPWSDLVDGVLAANAEFERVLASADERHAEDIQTARSILVVNRTRPDGRIEGEIFEVELGWKGYAMVQRLHLLDHRTQMRKILKRVIEKDLLRE